MAPFLIIAALHLAAGMSFVVAGTAWRRQSIPGRYLFGWLMIAIGSWSLLSAIHSSVAAVDLKLLTAKVQYLAIAFVPLLWLLVTRRAAGYLPLKRATAAWMLVIPLITIALAWTNERHGWIWSRTYLEGTALIYEHGFWFWIAVIYNYGLLLSAQVMLLRALKQTPRVFHGSLIMLLLAGAIPWLGNVMYLSRIVAIPGLDPTPLAFTATGLLTGWGLTRQRLFDLVPVARGVLIDHLSDGVMVFDSQLRLIDHNPAAHTLSGLPKDAIGQRLADIAPALAAVVAPDAAGDTIRLIEPFGPAAVSVEVHTSPLPGRRGRSEGWLLLLRDVTIPQTLARQLRAEHDFAMQVMQTMGEGLTVTDTEMRFTFVNDAYARLLGYAPADLIGRTPSDISPASEIQTLTVAQDARRNGHSSSYVTQVRSAAGELILVQVTGRPRFVDGAFAGNVAVITDLRERLAHEAALHGAVSVLRETEQQLRLSQLQLEQANAKLRELALTDGLTGLRNRAAFDLCLAEEAARGTRFHAPLSLLLIDIDQFKAYNDSFGHVAGDNVLRTVAQIFQEQSRQYDLVARYGGEEFAVILPNTDESESVLVAERIRLSIERTPWPARSVTISVGAATLRHSMTAQQLVEQADGALYRAKNGGRNRVLHAQQLVPSLKLLS